MNVSSFCILSLHRFRRDKVCTAKSPIKRIKRHRFLRKVCVALGNTGTPDDLPALQRAAQDEDPLIAEHAQWAIGEIEERHKSFEPEKKIAVGNCQPISYGSCRN